MTRDDRTVEIIREDRATTMRRLEAHKRQTTKLKIWFCKAKDLSPVCEYSQLIDLEVAGWPHNDFEILGKLWGLLTLRILHFPLAHDLSALSGLPNLRTLSLSTLPSWDASGKRQLLSTLKPLSALGNLEELELSAVTIEKDGLKPLGSLTQLRTLRINNDFPMSDFAYLASRLANAASSLTATEEFPGLRCQKCGASLHLLRGRPAKRSPHYACPKCRPAMITRHVAEYESLRDRLASR